MEPLVPRIEVKFRVEKASSAQLFKTVALLQGAQLYSDRWITSHYFDNPSLDMFHRTAEGITPRHKMRIRCYGVHELGCTQSHRLEIKETSEFGRSKSSTELVDFETAASKGLRLDNYGLCSPTVLVSYRRSYFAILDARMTIDTHIAYKALYNSNFALPAAWDSEIALELKASSNDSVERLVNSFGAQTRKFSKYERGVGLLRNLGPKHPL